MNQEVIQDLLQKRYERLKPALRTWREPPALASKPGETYRVAIAANGNLLELDMQRIPLPTILCGYQSIGAKF